MAKLGRKGQYDKWLEPDGLLLLSAWARNGLTDAQIAHNIGITAKTLYEWKNRFSDIRNSLKDSKEIVDTQVENALFKRAMGYKYVETTRERIKNPETGEWELEVTKQVTKEVAPDVTAQIIWLKNRKPKEWRDKQDIEHSGSVGVVIKDDIG